MYEINLGIKIDADKPNLVLGKLGPLVKMLEEQEGVTVGSVGVHKIYETGLAQAVCSCDAPTTAQGPRVAETPAEEPDDEPKAAEPAGDDPALRAKLLEACKQRDIIKRDHASYTVEVLKAKLQEWKDKQEAEAGEPSSSSSKPSDEPSQTEDASTSPSQTEPASSSADGATVDELRGVLRDFSQKKGANAAKALLKKFGATNASTVPEDKIGGCIAALTEAM